MVDPPSVAISTPGFTLGERHPSDIPIAAFHGRLMQTDALMSKQSLSQAFGRHNP
jgi:hypothetical protein